MLVPGHKYGSTDDVDGERALYKDLSSRKHLVRVYQEEWRRKKTQIECRRQQAEFDFMHRKVAE